MNPTYGALKPVDTLDPERDPKRCLGETLEARKWPLTTPNDLRRTNAQPTGAQGAPKVVSKGA